MTEWISVGVFFAIAAVFSYIVDYSPLRRRSLNAYVNRQRETWMYRLLTRDLRIIDTNIVASQLSGTGFFASTCLLGMGACFTLFTATDQILPVFAALHFNEDMTRADWQVRVLGLLLIYAYGFFKFGWAYRLFNYSAIMIGAAPYDLSVNPGDPHRSEPTQDARREALEHARRSVAINVAGSEQFNRGLRALFFSIGYLGGFAGAWAAVICTGLVAALLLYRQFASPAARALRVREDQRGEGAL